MTELYKKARYFLAKYQALSNAAEMIRSHGEEGFSFEDKYFNKEYQKQVEILAKQLNDRAEVFAKKYNSTGIDIECEIDENY